MFCNQHFLPPFVDSLDSISALLIFLILLFYTHDPLIYPANLRSKFIQQQLQNNSFALYSLSIKFRIIEVFKSSNCSAKTLTVTSSIPRNTHFRVLHSIMIGKYLLVKHGVTEKLIKAMKAKRWW